MGLRDWLLRQKKHEFGHSDILKMLNCLEDKNEEIKVRIAAAYAIGKLEMLPVSGLPVIGSDKNVSDEIIASFKKILGDKSEDYRLRLQVLASLKQQKGIISLIAPFLGSKGVDIITTLGNIARDETEDTDVRQYAAEVFLSIAPQKEE